MCLQKADNTVNYITLMLIGSCYSTCFWFSVEFCHMPKPGVSNSWPACQTWPGNRFHAAPHSRGNAYVSQSNSFHANTTAQALANHIAFMLTSKEREAQQKKKWRTKLRKWSYLNLKVICLTCFCLDFLKVTEKQKCKKLN